VLLPIVKCKEKEPEKRFTHQRIKSMLHPCMHLDHVKCPNKVTRRAMADPVLESSHFLHSTLCVLQFWFLLVIILLVSKNFPTVGYVRM
jgi:hypothetical protein